MMRAIVLACVAAGAVSAAAAPSIKVNGVGFPRNASKLAVVAPGRAATFTVVDAASGRTVLSGRLDAPARWEPSGERVRVADFSALRTPGSYRLRVPGLAPSSRFMVGDDPYRALAGAALKAFYFNRSGTALAPEHAGPYARAAGHPDKRVLVHASAASPGRPAGTVIAAARGWYDAGDYNKYIPSAAISTWTLLAAYEHFPEAWRGMDSDIPESGDSVPDILDEAMWNLEWMLAMQDPADGGVYHKLSNLRFDGMVMPHAAMTAPRYVVAKSTAAALDFAATMAIASRVVAGFEARWPGMAARMLAAGESAWEWARRHPERRFRNPPDVVTGEYGDARLDDEWTWAAAELYIATGKESYRTALAAQPRETTVPAWDDVRSLAWVSLAHHQASIGAAEGALAAARIEEIAARLAGEARRAGYRVGMRAPDFVWGSNAVMLNGALMLLQGYRASGKLAYLAAAQSHLDYVLGRNAVGRSFVTGFGARPPRHPHHRPSQADGIDAPVPGFVVGGPQPFQQDKAECPRYPSRRPALSWLDHGCSYASNEVAINWNAPLVYVAAALQVLTPGAGGNLMQDKRLAALLEEEAQLRFDRFDNARALALGLTVVELAGAKPVSVEIRRNDALLFFHAMAGAPPDHLEWIRRKRNLVNRTGHSSWYTHNAVLARGGDIDAIPGFDARDYAAHGGAFPLVLRGSGPVGTVTVSGLPGAEDHALVVRALRAHLGVDAQAASEAAP